MFKDFEDFETPYTRTEIRNGVDCTQHAQFTQENWFLPDRTWLPDAANSDHRHP